MSANGKRQDAREDNADKASGQTWDGMTGTHRRDLAEGQRDAAEREAGTVSGPAGEASGRGDAASGRVDAASGRGEARSGMSSEEEAAARAGIVAYTHSRQSAVEQEDSPQHSSPQQGSPKAVGRGPSAPSAEGARLVLATRNEHKVGELRAILAPLLGGLAAEEIAGANAFDVPEPVEDEVTFAGNALIKARHMAQATGVAALADDSGLAVDVLGGCPGVFSARWSGKHGGDRQNLELLLSQLADVPDRYRAAAFVCAAALVTPDGREYVRIGEMRGRLLREPRGTNGFGYDPIFCADGYEVSNAELAPEVKDAISHRGKAFRELAPLIRQELGLG